MTERRESPASVPKTRLRSPTLQTPCVNRSARDSETVASQRWTQNRANSTTFGAACDFSKSPRISAGWRHHNQINHYTFRFIIRDGRDLIVRDRRVEILPTVRISLHDNNDKASGMTCSATIWNWFGYGKSLSLLDQCLCFSGSEDCMQRSHVAGTVVNGAIFISSLICSSQYIPENILIKF